MAETRSLAGTRDSARVERLRDDAWALMIDAGRQLHSGQMALEPYLRSATSFQSREVTGRHRGIEPLAWLVLAAARMSLQYEMAARDWRRAVVPGNLVSAAVGCFDTALMDAAERRDLGSFLRRIPDLAAYACHRAGLPQAAPVIFEAVTSLMLDDRMMARSAQAYAQRPTAQSDLNGLLRQLRHLISESPVPPVRQATAAVGARTPFDELAPQIDALVQGDLALAAATAEGAGADGPASAYLLTSATTQAFMTAAASQRALIYVLAADLGGAALRVHPSGEPRVKSIELPGLTFSAVEAILSRIRALARDDQLKTRRRRAAHVDTVLDDVGSVIWAPMLQAWPEIRSSPIAVLPVGEVALLPLFTARTNGIPICTTADLTVAPSARALFLAEELRPAPDRTVLVAADPSPGRNPIPHVIDEALGVAAVNGTQALILSPAGRPPQQAASDGYQREFAQRLSSASLVHLACHGNVADGDPLDTTLQIGSQVRLGDILSQTLAAGSLVVLSACELGGIGTANPNEQMGFPGALLAAGARSVVGALWPVPDHPDTIEFMINYHRRLQKEPSNIALARAIGAAQDFGVLSTVWAPFTHFGAISPPHS